MAKIKLDLHDIFNRGGAIESELNRVIQEAVTNVIKHASTDRCTVTVDYQDDSLTVEVTDAGTGAGVTGDGYLAAGHGIAGMRERIAAFGGSLVAEPLARGFRVRAEVPIEGAM